MYHGTSHPPGTKKGNKNRFFYFIFLNSPVSFLVVEHHEHSSGFVKKRRAPTENARLVFIILDTADMLCQNVRRAVLARNEVQPHKSLVGSFFGVELSPFVRSALFGDHAVPELGDRRRTVVEYPHATVALMHELTPKAGERGNHLHTRDHGLDFNCRRINANRGLSHLASSSRQSPLR